MNKRLRVLLTAWIALQVLVISTVQIDEHNAAMRKDRSACGERIFSTWNAVITLAVPLTIFANDDPHWTAFCAGADFQRRTLTAADLVRPAEATQ